VRVEPANPECIVDIHHFTHVTGAGRVSIGTEGATLNI
jgi:hypothetical protein